GRGRRGGVAGAGPRLAGAGPGTDPSSPFRENYLDSSWRADGGPMPWALDGTISEENRVAIEKMLLEEQYPCPASAVAAPGVPRTGPDGAASPVRPAGGAAKWTAEERDLFEHGLARFGRRWTKIAKLIPGRTVFQVKGHARQYFKNKVRAGGGLGPEARRGRGTCPRIVLPSSPGRLVREAGRPGRRPRDPLPLHEDAPGDPAVRPAGGPPRGRPERARPPPPREPAGRRRPGPAEPPGGRGPGGRERAGRGPGPRGPAREAGGGEAARPPPDAGSGDDRSVIGDEEKRAVPEFFEGATTKTPERYLKIRNYILDQWERSKPRYLNKTSVRPGLKSCGDVNCIGRIHAYLESVGAINRGCGEEALPPRPGLCRSPTVSVGSTAPPPVCPFQRARRRRVRDPRGSRRDARDLEGRTFEVTGGGGGVRPRRSTVPASPGSAFDPFQLIPCSSFTAEKPEPFQVKVACEALLVMDLHAHTSMAEVIGLLGGRFSEADRLLEICTAEPCSSLSTGLQCEMDPVSQTQASEALAAAGYAVIGWYHSHPAFDPNPSLRDIDTQAKYQSYFSRGGAMFVGVIVSPYNRNNPLPYSQVTCLVISDETSPDGSYRLPYQFAMRQMPEEPRWELVFQKTRWIIEKYRLSHSGVPMGKIFHRASDLTCLQKLLASLRKTLGGPPRRFPAEEFLSRVQSLFLAASRAGPPAPPAAGSRPGSPRRGAP
uniref:Deubiquitinase MYSM1 n=1 Tax=Ornithorhynchus anatinus TaxID=9258 RepID=A0A6I8PPE1_ORNAN